MSFVYRWRHTWCSQTIFQSPRTWIVCPRSCWRNIKLWRSRRKASCWWCGLGCIPPTWFKQNIHLAFELVRKFEPKDGVTCEASAIGCGADCALKIWAFLSMKLFRSRRRALIQSSSSLVTELEVQRNELKQSLSSIHEIFWQICKRCMIFMKHIITYISLSCSN